MKNRILIVVYALIAMFLLSLDVILLFKVVPNTFISISGAVIFGVVGLAAAYLSFKCYKKEVKNASN